MDDIIEKKPSSPITTSLLVIAAVCMLAACALMCIELVELKGDKDTIADQRQSYKSRFDNNADIKTLRTEIAGVELDDEDDTDPDEDDTDPDDDEGDDEGG